MNILITSASRKVGLVREFQRAVSREGGGRVIATDADPYAAALYLADGHFMVPRGLEGDFFAAIERICRLESIRLIVPTRDEELLPFAQRRKALCSAGIEVMVADAATVETCQDKSRFVQFCASHNFRSPVTYGRGETPRFPVFTKGRYGKGGAGARRIEGPAQLDACLRETPDVLIQEHVDAPEFTIDLFCDFAGNVLTAVARERLKVFGGESFVGKTKKNARIIEECVRLAVELRLIGHNTIQCFFRDDQVLFIEVNPRFGGGAALGFAAGVSTPTRWSSC